MILTLHLDATASEMARPHECNADDLRAVVALLRGDVIVSAVNAELCRDIWCGSCNPDLFKFNAGVKL